MREIKFRVWNPSRKVLTSGLDLNILLMTTDMDFVTAFNKSGMVWMQYTGLKDKNGVEIYDGDIVAVFDNNNGYHNEDTNSYLPERLNREVKWHKDGGFTLEYDYGDYDITLLGWAAEHHELQFEVVGNIYQNSELINQ